MHYQKLAQILLYILYVDKTCAQSVRNGGESVQISKIGIIGAGNMAANLATLTLENNVETVLIGHSQDGMLRCRDKIIANLDDFIAAGVMSFPEKQAAMRKLTITTQWDVLTEADLVFEATKDDLDIKRAVIKRIEDIISESTPLLLYSATFPIQQLLLGTMNPARIIVGHPMRPVHIHRMVELVGHAHTPLSQIKEIQSFFENKLSCQVVVLKKDIPGLIGERITNAMLREARLLVETGVAEPHDIDKVICEAISFYYSNIGVLEDYDESRFLFGTQIQEGNDRTKAESTFYDWTKDRIEEYQAKRQKMIMQKLQQKLTKEPEQ